MNTICVIFVVLLAITGRGFSLPVNDALKGSDLNVRNEQQPLAQSLQQETSLLAESTQGHENQSERQARGFGLSFGGHGGHGGHYGLYHGHHGHGGSYGGNYGGPYAGGFGYGGYGGYGSYGGYGGYGHGHGHGYHHDHYHHYPHYGHHGYGF